MSTRKLPDAARTIQYRGHFWIDPEALGTLAHLTPGEVPREDVIERPTLCGQVILGRPLASVDQMRACARCTDRVLYPNAWRPPKPTP